MGKMLGHHFIRALVDAGLIMDDGIAWLTEDATVSPTRLSVRINARLGDTCNMVVMRQGRPTERVRLKWQPLFDALCEARVIERADNTRAVRIEADLHGKCLVRLTTFADLELADLVRSHAVCALDADEARVR